MGNYYLLSNKFPISNIYKNIPNTKNSKIIETISAAKITHPILRVWRKHPSLFWDFFSVLDLMGKEHLGQFSALSDTSDPHSGQLISAIFKIYVFQMSCCQIFIKKITDL